MKITMEPSEDRVRINGSEARVWYGVTDLGTQCEVFVFMIGVSQPTAATDREFNEALEARPVPLIEAVEPLPDEHPLCQPFSGLDLDERLFNESLLPE